MKDHEEFSTLSAAERRELIIAELKRAQAERIMSDMESCGVDIGLLNEMFTSKSEPDNAKYSKDGVSWSGQGRRPDAFKGLGAVELERYRIPQKK